METRTVLIDISSANIENWNWFSSERSVKEYIIYIHQQAAGNAVRQLHLEPRGLYIATAITLFKCSIYGNLCNQWWKHLVIVQSTNIL